MGLGFVWVAWLIASALMGYFASGLLGPKRLAERVAIALAVGWSIGTSISFLFFILMGGNWPLVTAASIALFLVLALVFNYATVFALGKQSSKLAEGKGSLFLLVALLFVFTLLIGYLYYNHSFVQIGENYYSMGGASVDDPFHLTLSDSFAFGANSNGNLFSLVFPIYSTARLTYPFMPDFQGAILIANGATPSQAFAIVGLLLSLSIIVLFYCLAEKYCQSSLAAFLSVALYFLAGNLAYIYNFPGVGTDYTNFIVAGLIPQRGLLFGLALGILVFSLLYSSIFEL